MNYCSKSFSFHSNLSKQCIYASDLHFSKRLKCVFPAKKLIRGCAQLVDKGEQLSKSVLGYESAVLPSSRGFPPTISSKPLNRKSDSNTSTYRVDEMCPFFCLCLVYIPVAVGAVLRLASRWIHSPLASVRGN